MRFLPIALLLVLFVSCSWLLEEPLPRTNPADENAAVYYFRAIPRYNGGGLDQVRLKWNWSEEDPHNPGRVTILRKSTGYPQSISDPGAVEVYSSPLDVTETIDDLGSDQTGNTYYYALFYRIYGFSDQYELWSPPTVFAVNSGLPLDTLFTASFSYDGTDYGGTYWELSAATPPPPPSLPVIRVSTPSYFESYGIFVPNVYGVPSLAIDIISADLSYDSDAAGTVYFSRVTDDAGENKSNKFYFEYLKYPGGWTAENELTGAVNSGSTLTLSGFENLIEDWLDTLDFYGIRIAADPGVAVNLVPHGITIDYVGPPP